MGKFVEADLTAKDGLTIVKDGKLQAQLLIQEGDIYYEEGEKLEKAGDHDAALQKWKDAAGKYIVPSQIFVDPQITPEALFKAARALNRAGEASKAEELLKQLKSRYPEYRPPGM